MFNNKPKQKEMVTNNEIEEVNMEERHERKADKKIGEMNYNELVDYLRDRQDGLLYSSNFGRNVAIIWRPITAKDYEEILEESKEDQDIDIRNRVIVKKCVVAQFVDNEPTSLDSILESRFGITRRLCDEIMIESGFDCVTKRL